MAKGKKRHHKANQTKPHGKNQPHKTQNQTYQRLELTGIITTKTALHIGTGE